MDVGIFVFNGADELDVVGPYRVFSSVNDVAQMFTDIEPVTLHLISQGLGSVQLAGGLVIIPTDAFLTSPSLDVLVVPGGSSEDKIGRRAEQNNENALEFIRQASESASVTASVCTGAFLLAEAGLLSSRKVNTHWRFRDELRDLMTFRGEHVEIVPERVVWDGDLVTAGGVTAGIDLALSIVEKKFGEEVRGAVERVLELETPDL